MGHEDLCHFGITVQTLPAHAVKFSLEDPDPCQAWLYLLCHNASHHLLLASGSLPQHRNCHSGQASREQLLEHTQSSQNGTKNNPETQISREPEHSRTSPNVCRGHS